MPTDDQPLTKKEQRMDFKIITQLVTTAVEKSGELPFQITVLPWIEGVKVCAEGEETIYFRMD
jgi:hypothetical protein